MSESRELLCGTAGELFGRLSKVPYAQAWTAVVDAGFPGLLVPESRGGFGGDWGDALAVLRLAGAHSVSLPLGECIVAASLAASLGVELPSVSTSIAPRMQGRIEGERFSGAAFAVPWGQAAEAVMGQVDKRLVVLRTAGAQVIQGVNPAGEARDTMKFEAAPAITAVFPGDLHSYGAFVRVAQCSGAMAAALALAIEHVNTRIQFGKPLAKLQAVQQSLAVAAGEAAAVDAAACGFADALDRRDAQFEAAAAKLRTNWAIAQVTAITHQVHGAIGFTHEYPLHYLTRRLMGWRSEFGNDSYWAGRLGSIAAHAGGAGLWAEITRRTDRH